MGKTLTHIEYLNKLSNKNIDVVPLEEYKGTDIKIWHKCSCGNKWKVKPSNVLRGSHCKECQKRTLADKYRISHEEFIQRHQHQFNKNVKLLSKYYDYSTEIKCLCLVCNQPFNILPDSLSKGHMHKECADKLAGLEKRYTQEEFVEIAKQNNPTIIITGNYIGMDKPVDVKCSICNYEWSPVGGSIRSGQGCPKCAGKIPPTEEEFNKKANSLKNCNIRILGKYQDSTTKIECECINCKTPFGLFPYQIYNGVGCNKCARKENGKRLTKTHFSFVQQLKEINSNILLLSEYTGSHDHIYCMCLKCSNIWFPEAGSITNQRTGCPECAESQGEKKIASILKKYNIKFEAQKTFRFLVGIADGDLSYDFYLPQYNKLIEFQGEQHEHPINYFGGQEAFAIQQEHDKRKREYALTHKIGLIEIWYYSFDEIEQILIDTLNLNSETVTTAG